MHNELKIKVRTHYVAEQSDVEQQQYVFAYVINITNVGQQAVSLLHRHWYISDANEEVQEVQGKGVLGKQPNIAVGESFEYSSGVVLPTPVGTMHGSYEMQGADGTVFEAPIPTFLLSLPKSLH